MKWATTAESKKITQNQNYLSTFIFIISAEENLATENMQAKDGRQMNPTVA